MVGDWPLAERVFGQPVLYNNICDGDFNIVYLNKVT